MEALTVHPPYKKCCLPAEQAKRVEAMVERRLERTDAVEGLHREFRDVRESDAGGLEPAFGNGALNEDSDYSEESRQNDEWWYEFYDEYLEITCTARLRELALKAIRDAPTFCTEDGAELIEHIEPLLETVDDGQALMDVIEAWKKHRPETCPDEAAWLALKRVHLAQSYGLGDLEDAVMTAARDAAEEIDRFEPLVLEPLAWSGKTDLLVKAVTAAWSSYLANEACFVGGVVENLALRGIEANMAAECEGLAVDADATETLTAMAVRLTDESSAAEYLSIHRRHRGLAEATPGPVTGTLADQTFAPVLASLLWTAGKKLRTEHSWPAARVELAASAWTDLVWKTERDLTKTGRGAAADQAWLLFVPTRKLISKWWRAHHVRFFPEYLKIAAWIASLPTWIDLFFADAPVPPRTAQGLAEAVEQVAADVLDKLDVLGRDLALVREGVRRCTEWAETLVEQQSANQPAYFEDEDIRALVTAGDSVTPALWHRIVDRGAEVLPLLHPLLDDLLLADLDDEPIPGASRYLGAIHGAFIAATIGDLTSLPHIIDLAGRAENDEWLHEGLAWFPTALGPASIKSFLDFVRNRSLKWYQRAAVAKGVVWAAGQHPELRDQVAVGLVAALDSDYDTDLVTALVRPAVATGDERTLEAVRRAYERDMVDDAFCGDLEHALSEDEAWFLELTPIHLTTEDYFAQRAVRSAGSRTRALSKAKQKRQRNTHKAARKKPHKKKKKKKKGRKK